MNTSKMAYIDIDGVLARWQLHEVGRQVGRKITEAHWPIHHGWDIVSTIHELGGRDYRSHPMDFWASVTESSWATAPRTEEFDYIIAYCVKLVGCYNVRICTAPPPDHNPAAYSGKAIWIKTHLPSWLHRQVIFTENKGELATPDRLLVDDADHNRVAWEIAGGHCILVPRPWNVHNGIPIDEYMHGRFAAMEGLWDDKG